MRSKVQITTTGLGVPDIKDLNLCLLGSWVKRYIKDENKLWRSIVDRKKHEHFAH
jgi:hypothetical protein